MTDFTKGRGQGTGAGLEPKNQSQSGSGYQSKLDEILARAGNNNPIAAAQARNTGKAAAQPSPNNTSQSNPAQTPQAVPPAAQPPMPPAAQPAPANPADPSQKLQQILAMAGQTPAQRAQSQAQQAQQNNVNNLNQGIAQYLQALQQDITKMLQIDAEFPNLGSPDEYYLRCYADVNGNMFWDLHGNDIDYQLQNTVMTKYQLHEDYYKGIPDTDLKAVFSTAKIHRCLVL